MSLPPLLRRYANYIRNPRAEGSSAGTPGTAPTNWSFSNTSGVTTSIGATGTEGGYPYIDFQISGSATSAGVVTLFFDTQTGISALTGQTWTLAMPIYATAGSLTNITSIQLNMQEFDTVPALLGNNLTTISVGFTGPLSRSLLFGATSTLSRATTASVRPSLRINITGIAATAITLRLGAPMADMAGAVAPVLPLPPVGSPGLSVMWV